MSKQSKQGWVAVEKVLRRAGHEPIDLANPPKTDEDLMWIAAGVTDLIVPAFLRRGSAAVARPGEPSGARAWRP